MFDVLNSYLFQHKSLSIPGLGSIYMEALPASLDSATQNMLPPLYYFRYDKYVDSPDKQFFSYLAAQKNVADYEAIRIYNEFCHELRERINQNEKVEWESVGALSKDPQGNIHFESALTNPQFLQPVPARKVIHPDARHVLLVGDTERTTVEMNEWLSQDHEESGKKSWWIYALVAGIVAILFLVFYFASHGWTLESTGNQQTLQTGK